MTQKLLQNFCRGELFRKPFGRGIKRVHKAEGAMRRHGQNRRY